MTFSGDPYRVLGLNRGASLDDVKRAYRALAKRYHPDSAGEAAVPRFLAIQAAYEALTSPPRARPSGAAGAAAQPASSPPPGRASSADAERARATREAYRARRSWSPGGAGTSARPGTAGPSGTNARPGTAGPSGPRPASAPPGAGPGSSSESGPTSSRRPPSGRVASMGSTSYDDATEWEPEWTGGTWYGTTSGTHWTVNPREYADPRKHGPEYLARARRRVEEAAARSARAAGSAPPTDDAAPTPAYEDEDAPAAPDRAGSAAPDEGPGPAAGPASYASASRAAYRARRDGPAPSRATFDDADAGGSGTGAAAAAAAAAASLPARVVAALLAWPPLGYLAALVIGEVTGCARFAAGCTDDASLAMWALQPLIVGILLLLPFVARPLAVGAIALVIAAVPTAAALSASAGNRGPTRETVGMFLAIVVMAYVVAAVGAATGKIPLPAWLRQPQD